MMYAIVGYLSSMEGELDSRCEKTDGRKVVYAGSNPVNLLRNANAFTYAVMGLILLLIAVIFLLVRLIAVKRKKKKMKQAK